MASSVLCKMLFWVVDLGMTILFWFKSFLGNMEGKWPLPICLIKIDLRKAFDSVQWFFLRHLLLLLSFPDRFVHLVMKCVETTSYSIAINEELYGFFPERNGVRQGDPLSPYLFITYMEYFSRMLKLTSQNSTFHFHLKCGRLGISHLTFVDDILLVSRGDKSSVQTLFQQLMIFGKTSGLDINVENSSIYFGGVLKSLKQTILQNTRFKDGAFPFK
jgi:hypothetical protein